MVWEKGIQDDLGHVHLLVPLSSFNALKLSPDRVFTQGMGMVHLLAEVGNDVGWSQSQYCYARRAHLTPMP